MTDALQSILKLIIFCISQFQSRVTLCFINVCRLRILKNWKFTLISACNTLVVICNTLVIFVHFHVSFSFVSIYSAICISGWNGIRDIINMFIAKTRIRIYVYILSLMFCFWMKVTLHPRTISDEFYEEWWLHSVFDYWIYANKTSQESKSIQCGVRFVCFLKKKKKKKKKV